MKFSYSPFDPVFKYDRALLSGFQWFGGLFHACYIRWNVFVVAICKYIFIFHFHYFAVLSAPSVGLYEDREVIFGNL